MYKHPLVVAFVAVIALISVFLFRTQFSQDSSPLKQAFEEKLALNTLKEPTALGPAEYVGRDKCSTCHQQQYLLWQGSHHDLAMQEVNKDTVLGDFNNTAFTYYDVTSTFYKKDDKFFVKTDNADGELQEFEIKYTFGVTPLQQYLIAFPGGRLQALNVVWDTRAKENGGQRWFHLYPNENVNHKDPLHWTGVYQNWNNMCAECHSTNLKKDYELEKDEYNTTWSEIDVSCEACHGPASNHLKWTQTAPEGKYRASLKNKGLLVSLKDPKQGKWQFLEDNIHAQRTSSYNTTTLLETCARCHARRGVFSDDYRHGRPFMDTHMPALLTEELYYADGQIKDEVYVYASFLQSKMHQAGVVCNDCHEPHSLKFKAMGNDLCTRCHAKSHFDSPAHHHHPANSDGAQCISCHMPQSNYMVVDPRADHSMRIPRPDLSDKLETPNACNRCHSKQSNQWAAQKTAHWYGPRKAAQKYYGEIIHAARNRQIQADIELADLALDSTQPGIIRATAISLLENYAYPKLPQLLEQAITDSDPLVRTSALNLLETMEPSLRVQYAAPLVSDSVRAVRTTAARVLADAPANSFTQNQGLHVTKILQEYIAAQEYNADRPEGLINLGTLYVVMNDPLKAELYLKKAIKLTPALAQSYVNLADLYRMQRKDEEGATILRQGLDDSMNPAPIHHSLGLLLVRNNKIDEALRHLQKASELAPTQARYAYVYGVALQSSKGTQAAINYLKTAAKRHPADLNILYAVAAYSLDNGDKTTASQFANDILILAPQHQGAQQLLRQLEPQ